jgi:A/G-specific adenine glycosylase
VEQWERKRVIAVFAVPLRKTRRVNVLSQIPIGILTTSLREFPSPSVLVILEVKSAGMSEVWIEKLTQWYRAKARALPWRENHDPYSIWISEIMLQQTQVATVIPYFRRFMNSFPTIEALANAPLEKVFRHWAGLGYYSRAKNIHKGAKFLQLNYPGTFPKTRDAILEVPGIGPYTAGAVLSIAFGLAEPLVDGNVQRVFARFFAIQESTHLSKTQKKFWELAENCVKKTNSPRDFNQALMELGATVCTKGKPHCELCPINNYCEARRLGIQEKLPVKKKPRAKIELKWDAFVLENEGKYFLKKNEEGNWWAGLWDFPKVEQKEKWPPFTENLQVEPLPVKKHNVTHHHIYVSAFRVPMKRRPKILWKGEWFSKKEIASLPLSSLAAKIWQEID